MSPSPKGPSSATHWESEVHATQLPSSLQLRLSAAEQPALEVHRSVQILFLQRGCAPKSPPQALVVPQSASVTQSKHCPLFMQLANPVLSCAAEEHWALVVQGPTHNREVISQFNNCVPAPGGPSEVQVVVPLLVVVQDTQSPLL